MPRDEHKAKHRGVKHKKQKSRGYCIKCLRKFYKKRIPADKQCPSCREPLRFGTPRTVAQVVTRCARQRGIKKPTTKTDYQRYINSTAWRSIRRRILDRDNGLCQMCGLTANQVHHRSYAKEVLDGNADEYLVSLCRECHEAIEFTRRSGVKRVKNGLRTANDKLDAAIAKRGRCTNHPAISKQSGNAMNAKELANHHVPVAQVRDAINASEMTTTKH